MKTNSKFKKSKCLFLGIFISGTYFSGCAANSNFSTARLSKKNGFEVIPNISKNIETSGPYKSFDNGPIDENIVVGVLTTYGFNDKTNILLGYGIRNKSNYDIQNFRIEIKRSIKSDKQAVGLGYRYFQLENINQIDITTYSNIDLTENTYLCISPTFNPFFISGGSFSFSGYVNGSLTHEFYKKYFIRPEIGFGAFTIFSNLIFNIGISGGISL